MTAPVPHLNFEQLTDLAEDRLDVAERHVALDHLQLCPLCTEQLEWLRQTIDLLRQSDDEDAPAHVLARAIRLMRPLQPAAASGLRRLLGHLRFDSQQMAPVAGLRSTEDATRQVLFGAEEYDLDVRISAHDTQRRVFGQLLGPGSGGRIELASADQHVWAELNELGEFVLPEVPPGHYRLRLQLAGIELLIEAFEIT